uniref:Uncharacterized protein n=1 Tax=Rhodosorus marinus TaxID=101924 RepID=A0A7S0BN27_9RHOD|mmetsp:Transcript_23178/g.33257  ORF Transcript_23178/g.33257 Transcript_23178/m.33257 type:complete len:101 (+) Transcript_23178:94-396(+)
MQAMVESSAHASLKNSDTAMGLGFLVPGGIRVGGNAVGRFCSSTRRTVVRASEGDESKDRKSRDWDTEWQKFRENKEVVCGRICLSTIVQFNDMDGLVRK